jgi:predicted RNA-binding protein
MVNYWLCVIHSGENWEKVKENLVWGVSDRWRKTVGRVKVNDELVFYVSKEGFVGIFAAISDYYHEETRIWTDDVYSHRIKLSQISIPEKPISPNGFFKHFPKSPKGYFRITMRNIPEDEFLLIKDGLFKVSEAVAPESKPIDKYIEYAKRLINKHPRMSEANTISSLVEPLLEYLGWDIRDLDEIERKYPVPGGKGAEFVDIALKIDNIPKVFIEAKSLATDLKDHLVQQLLNYALLGNVSWCILTNGRELRLYSAFWKVIGIEQRLFRSIDAVDADKPLERAKELFGTETPTEEQLKKASEDLIGAACAPFDDPKLRNTLIEVRKRSEQIIDTVSKDYMFFAGYDERAKERAKVIVDTFSKFI